MIEKVEVTKDGGIYVEGYVDSGQYYNVPFGAWIPPDTAITIAREVIEKQESREGEQPCLRN